MSEQRLLIKTTVTTETELGIDQAAEWFCGLDDDQMAKFFVAVAAKAKAWPNPPNYQWSYVGGHLRNCECSTEDAREMIRSWAYFLEHSTHV